MFVTQPVRRFRRLLPIILAVAALAPALLAQQLPDVVARVEGYEISREELVTQAEILRVRAQRSGQPDPGSGLEFYRQVLEGLVGELLVYADAKERGAAANPAEVDGALAKMQTRFSSPEAFVEQIEKQGATLEDVRSQLERTLTIEKVIREEIEPKIRLDDEAPYKFWQQNPEALRTSEQRRVRHIFLLPEGEGGWDRARQQAEVLREQIRGGADFADLALRHSDDAGSKERGGELGWVEAGAATSPVAEAALAMDPGQGPRVVDGPDGVHILDLMEVRPSRVPSFEEAGPGIEKKMREYMIQVEVVARTEQLRETAQVEILI